SFSYLNNLYLLPKFLFEKKKNIYLSLVLCLIVFFALIHSLFLKSVIHYYPQIKIFQISYITSPVSDNWSFLEIGKEIFQYAIIYCFWAFVFTMARYMSHYSRQEKII